MSNSEFPPLKAEEEIIIEDSAKRIRNQGQTKDKGTLILTNQRVIFGRKASFISKPKIRLDISLDEVEKTETKGLIRKELVINYMGENRVGESEYKTEYFKVSDEDRWLAKLKEMTQ
ncbi:MAG: hypothetical protein GF317_16130 [Candidatus Lokiarchaeota archaeon]|nr:hypothetical protein [Candidatus Lokiarchaeota archaeon]MBD3201063.1 hypothetical protein [Candidatus Lokiarchaeota archaeon]